MDEQSSDSSVMVMGVASVIITLAEVDKQSTTLWLVPAITPPVTSSTTGDCDWAVQQWSKYNVSLKRNTFTTVFNNTWERKLCLLLCSQVLLLDDFLCSRFYFSTSSDILHKKKGKDNNHSKKLVFCYCFTAHSCFNYCTAIKPADFRYRCGRITVHSNELFV